MPMQRIFSRVFEERGLDSLLWAETKRHGPKEFFGIKPEDELEPPYFKESNDSEGIAPAIADAFHYTLQAPKLKAGFGQNYYSCTPLATYQYISFTIVPQRNQKQAYSNPLAGVQGFEFLTEANITFYRGRYGSPQTEIEMESQNVGVHRYRG